MSDPVLIEYRYGIRRWLCLFPLIILTAAVGAGLYFGWVRPDNIARMLGRFFAIMGAPLIALLGWGFVSTYTHRMRLALTATALIAPKPNWMGISRKEVEIPFAHIKGLSGVGRLRIHFINDSVRIIPGDMMESPAAFEDLRRRLAEAVRRNREAPEEC